MRFRDVYKNMERRFEYGNTATITREEWNAINKVITELEEWLKADQETKEMIKQCEQDPDCKDAINYLANH